MKRKEVPKKAQTNNQHIFNSPNHPKTPRKTVQPTDSKKTKLTPLKTLDASDDDISSADKQQFLMLEIKQLKRENNFLKKKLSDLTAQFGLDKYKPKRMGSKEKQNEKGSLQNLQSLPLSINICFEQIHNVLNTIVKLFRIDFTEEEIAAYDKKQSEEIKQACPLKKYVLLKKYILKRKLERIMLEDQQKKYPLFLDLFTQYYEFKEQSDCKIIEVIDHMTTKAHELNQWIIQKAQERKKGKCSLSTIRNDQPPITVQTLKSPLVSPRNYVTGQKVSTYSPANARNAKKLTKFAMSPTEKAKNINDF